MKEFIRKKPVKIIGSILGVIVLALYLLVGFSARWYRFHFNGTKMDEIIYTLRAPLEGTESSMVTSYLTSGLAPAVLCLIMFLLAVVIIPRFVNLLDNRGKEKEQQNPNNGVKWNAYLAIGVLLLWFIVKLQPHIVHAEADIELFTWIKYKLNSSSLYEDHYIDPASVAYEFPDKKRNLVYIVMESMEVTFMSEAEGGAMEDNLIPYLTEYAQTNTAFTEGDSPRGAVMLETTHYTVGSLVAQTSACQLIVPTNLNSYNGHGSFLPGVYSIGELLEEQGYKNVFMCGSNAAFGGRKEYFSDHGNYEILDYNWAKKAGKIPEDYKEWWGFEDLKLYEYAKEELLELAASEDPFNFTMLTVDTHHVGGYLCAECPDTYEEQYSNVISCADHQIYDFIEWLKEQEFYEDTAIVIVGDHPSMDPFYFTDLDEEYRRSPYNVFINSAAEPVRSSERAFSQLDMFPTTLAAMGVTIEGDRVGLGTNLFSNEDTLLEALGTEYMSEEVRKNSKYYTEKILYS